MTAAFRMVTEATVRHDHGAERHTGTWTVTADQIRDRERLCSRLDVASRLARNLHCDALLEAHPGTTIGVVTVSITPLTAEEATR